MPPHLLCSLSPALGPWTELKIHPVSLTVPTEKGNHTRCFKQTEFRELVTQVLEAGKAKGSPEALTLGAADNSSTPVAGAWGGQKGALKGLGKVGGGSAQES